MGSQTPSAKMQVWDPPRYLETSSQFTSCIELSSNCIRHDPSNKGQKSKNTVHKIPSFQVIASDLFTPKNPWPPPKPLLDLLDKSSRNPPNQRKLHLPGKQEALPDWQGDRGGASGEILPGIGSNLRG